MANSVLSKLLDAGSQTVPTDGETQRLFHPATIRVEKLSLRVSAPRVTESVFTNVQELRDGLSESSGEQLSFIFLRQRDSWDYIQLNYHAFIYLMQTCRVFTPFWDFVHGFGLKFEPKDENVVSLKSRLSSDLDDSKVRESELCYNIRYFEKHNRPGTKAIWSERQVAVYHKLDIVGLRSLWILIQPSENMESRLRDVMQHMEQINQAATDHLDLHALLVLAVMANWRSYINYLEGLLSEVDEKALNSRVGSTCYLDYTVTFRDAQDLELIRRKLLKTSMILRSNADVGRSLHRYINKLGKAIGPDEILSSLELFDQYTANLEMHTRIVDSLLERLTGTSKLIFHILAYRHEETSLATSTAICNNGDQIKKLTEQAATESDLMIVLTRGMHNDSKLIKILTFLALLYTPASLAATIFSSNLIQIETTSGGSTYMVLVSDFWKYPLLAVILIIITIASMFVWRKYWPLYRQKFVSWMP